MSDQRRESAAPVEPYFDRTPAAGIGGTGRTLFRSHAAAVWRRSAGPAGLRRLAADAASAHRELCRQASRRHALRQRARPRHCRAAFPLAAGGAAGRARVPRRARRPGRTRRRPAPWRHRRQHGRCRPPRDRPLARRRFQRAGCRRRGCAARLWRHRPGPAGEPGLRSATGLPQATATRARLAARRCRRDAALPARRNCPRARWLLRPLGRRLRHPDRLARAHPVRTLQRIRRRRSCDPELVDDEGDHLHRDRPPDSGRLARLGIRPGAGAAVARSARDPPGDHARSPAAHALGARVSRGARRRPRNARLREQRGVSGRRRRVRSGTTLDRRHRARRGIPVHQQRPQRARRYHPRPDRTARAAVLRDLVRSAGRSPRHGELPAFRRHRGQSDRVGGRLRDLARLREARCAILAERHVGRRAAPAAGLGRIMR